MRIVIDMQGAQTESRFRGIGRYSLSLALGIVRNRGDHEVYLVLNGMLDESIENIRAAFAGLLPQSHIRCGMRKGQWVVTILPTIPEEKWRSRFVKPASATLNLMLCM